MSTLNQDICCTQRFDNFKAAFAQLKDAVELAKTIDLSLFSSLDNP